MYQTLKKKSLFIPLLLLSFLFIQHDVVAQKKKKKKSKGKSTAVAKPKVAKSAPKKIKDLIKKSKKYEGYLLFIKIQRMVQLK